jgi:hypothetical protein
MERPIPGSGAGRGYARRMLRLLRLEARVKLDDPGRALAEAERAAGAGDESWERWIAEFRGGQALIVALEVTVTFDGVPGTLRVANRGVFVEKHPEPPKVEQQIAEVVSKDFPLLARDLSHRGHHIDEAELGEMYVHVELGEDVRAALTTGGRSFPGAERPTPRCGRPAPSAPLNDRPGAGVVVA